MANKTNIVDKITDESTKIVMSVKSVKWIIGILSTAILALGSFAWGLYVSVDSKVDEIKQEVLNNADKNQDELINRFEELEKYDVKDNTTKNYQQDAEIGILFDRTNSRGNSINNNVVRPTDTSTGPNIP